MAAPITVFVCGRGGSKNRCKCGRYATRACDFALSGKKAGHTCDAPLCDTCTTRVGTDRDLCGPHARVNLQLGSGG